MNARLVVDNSDVAERVDFHTTKIATLFHRCRQAYIDMGRALLEAKNELPYGQFKKMLYERLPFSPDTAQQFMRIAADPLLTHPATSPHLPDSAEALDQIRRLSPTDVREAIKTGDINPQMTVADAKALVGTARPLYDIKGRAPHELRRPIVLETELIATLIGYREAAGVPQLAADQDAAFEDGYTGKLEIGTRRAWHESFFSWIYARRLAIILVPAVDAVRTDLCPCCRQRVGP